MGIISSASLWTELIPILSEGGNGDTTYKSKRSLARQEMNYMYSNAQSGLQLPKYKSFTKNIQETCYKEKKNAGCKLSLRNKNYKTVADELLFPLPNKLIFYEHGK